MALSGRTLDELVKPQLKTEWEVAKKEWFPSSDNYAYDLREPGQSIRYSITISIEMTLLIFVYQGQLFTTLTAEISLSFHISSLDVATF